VINTFDNKIHYEYLKGDYSEEGKNHLEKLKSLFNCFKNKKNGKSEELTNTKSTN